MNKIDMGSALMDMQKLANQAQLKPLEKLNQIDDNAPQNFAELLKTAVDNVNAAQKTSGHLKKAFEMGDPSVDLPQVMVASQKAGVAFQAMLTVRGNLLKAYQDIMSMPV